MAVTYTQLRNVLFKNDMLGMVIEPSRLKELEHRYLFGKTQPSEGTMLRDLEYLRRHGAEI